MFRAILNSSICSYAFIYSLIVGNMFFIQKLYIYGLLYRSILWQYLIIGLFIYYRELYDFDLEDDNADEIFNSEYKLRYLIVFWPLLYIINMLDNNEE